MTGSAARASVGTGLRSSEVVGGDLHLVLNNTIDAIEDGRVEFRRHLAPLGLDPLVINRLEVVFEELVSNVVRHGFMPHSDQSIAVAVSARPGSIEFVFEDDGSPFNLLEAPTPEPFTSLETAKLGGLGILLVRKMSSHVGYEAVPVDAPRRDLAGRPFRPRNRVSISIATAA